MPQRRNEAGWTARRGISWAPEPPAKPYDPSPSNNQNMENNHAEQTVVPRPGVIPPSDVGRPEVLCNPRTRPLVLGL